MITKLAVETFLLVLKAHFLELNKLDFHLSCANMQQIVADLSYMHKSTHSLLIFNLKLIISLHETLNKTQILGL